MTRLSRNSCHLLFWTFLASIPRVKTALLAETKLEACDNTGAEELECEQKAVILLSIEQAQVLGTEALEVIVKNDEIRAEKPIKITWSKTRSRWKYPLRYNQQVTSRMIEKYGVSSTCIDDFGGVGATCGVLRGPDGTYIEYSEGFCCTCALVVDLLDDTQMRGGVDCGNLFDNFSQSYHCMAPDKLWYAVFEVETPIMQYEINVQVDTGDMKHNVTVSHTNPIASNPYVVVTLTGDLATARPANTFQHQYLVVPDRFYDSSGKLSTHERILQPPHHLKYAMLLDKSFFDLTGETCNKIGVGPKAFKFQPDKCESQPGNCLWNQIEDLHKGDIARGDAPMYFVSRYCDGALEGTQVVDENNIITDEFFICPLDESRQTTLVRLELRADDLKLISNIGGAKILNMAVNNFEAFSGTGEVEVTLEATVPFAADYGLGLDCKSGVTPAPTPMVSLKANEKNRIVTIPIMANSKEEVQSSCTLNLMDVKGKVLATKSVDFTVLKTVEMVDSGFNNQGVGNAEYSDAINYADPGCPCGFFLDFGCMFSYFAHCVEDIIGALIFIVVMILIGWLVLTGRCKGLMSRAKNRGKKSKEDCEERERERRKTAGSSGFEQNRDMKNFMQSIKDQQDENRRLQEQIRELQNAQNNPTSPVAPTPPAPAPIAQPASAAPTPAAAPIPAVAAANPADPGAFAPAVGTAVTPPAATPRAEPTPAVDAPAGGAQSGMQPAGSVGDYPQKQPFPGMDPLQRYGTPNFGPQGPSFGNQNPQFGGQNSIFGYGAPPQFGGSMPGQGQHYGQGQIYGGGPQIHGQMQGHSAFPGLNPGMNQGQGMNQGMNPVAQNMQQQNMQMQQHNMHLNLMQNVQQQNMAQNQIRQSQIRSQEPQIPVVINIQQQAPQQQAQQPPRMSQNPGQQAPNRGIFAPQDPANMSQRQSSFPSGQKGSRQKGLGQEGGGKQSKGEPSHMPSSMQQPPYLQSDMQPSPSVQASGTGMQPRVPKSGMQQSLPSNIQQGMQPQPGMPRTNTQPPVKPKPRIPGMQSIPKPKMPVQSGMLKSGHAGFPQPKNHPASMAKSSLSNMSKPSVPAKPTISTSNPGSPISSALRTAQQKLPPMTGTIRSPPGKPRELPES